MSKRLTLEFVKSETKKIAEGYECISEEYINANSKLKFICNHSHEFMMRWGNFSSIRNRCPHCFSLTKRGSSLKLSIEYVKEKTREFAEGYECISNEYVNNHTKLKFICPSAHQFFASWNSFVSSRCPYCAGVKKKTIEEVNEYVKKFGYKCLSEKYVNSKGKLEIMCDKGHIYKTTWGNIQDGCRCSICEIENKSKRVSGSNHHNWKGGVKKKDIPLYDTYALQLNWVDDVRRNPENKKVLQVRCTESNCGKWFCPSTSSVRSRIKVLNGIDTGASNFYCSQKCKNSCAIYNQKKYPRNNKPDNRDRKDQSEWRRLVLDRDNHECQRCGNTKNLIAHHIEGLFVNPLESADIDIGITLCKKCNKLAHKEIGCRTIDLRRESICNESYLHSYCV